MRSASSGRLTFDDELRPEASEMGISPLRDFVGEWQLAVDLPGAGDVRGHVVFEMVGELLIQRTTVPVPEAPDSCCVVVAGADGSYLQHYFDSRRREAVRDDFRRADLDIGTHEAGLFTAGVPSAVRRQHQRQRDDDRRGVARLGRRTAVETRLRPDLHPHYDRSVARPTSVTHDNALRVRHYRVAAQRTLYAA